VKERTEALLRVALHARAGRRARREYMAVDNIVRGVICFDRPAWLYRARSAVPRVEMHFRPACPVGNDDVALCRRLIDAYRLARVDAPPTEGMWSHDIFETSHRDVAETLERRDAAALAGCLASMFRSDVVLGMALGSIGVTTVARRSTRISAIFALNCLVALAESQGAAATGHLPQGLVGAFVDGLDVLVAKTEGAVGVGLDFPHVGAPYGISAAGRLITQDSPDQIYAATRLRDAIRRHLFERERPLTFVEIGGGYGGMAYWLNQMLDLRYVIVDLPIVNVLQGYFLSQAMGCSEVALYGETPRRVTILPTHACSRVPRPFDVLANKNSMPEIPRDALLEYLLWARDGCSGIFYSYNQEFQAPYAGTPQNLVPEIVSRIGGFELISRELSWLRRGYVEELYTCSCFTPATPARPGSAPAVQHAQPTAPPVPARQAAARAPASGHG
jgi:hypothetical protein